MNFGKSLLERRKKLGLSQAELAKMVGIHPNVLGRYERGDASPSIEAVVKLADALGVSVDYLVGKTDLELDNDIVNKILIIQRLPQTEKDHILFTIDALIRDAKFRHAYGG